MDHTQNKDVVSIVVETALDEAMLIGTPDSFRKLAAFLLDCASAVEARPEKQMAFGVDSLGFKPVSPGLFDSLAEVVPGSLLFVNSDRDRYKICVSVGGGLHS